MSNEGRASKVEELWRRLSEEIMDAVMAGEMPEDIDMSFVIPRSSTVVPGVVVCRLTLEARPDPIAPRKEPLLRLV